MAAPPPLNIAVLGAGDIGCAVGIALAAWGHDVAFIGRSCTKTGDALKRAASTGGATVVHEKSGWSVCLSAEACSESFTTDAARLAAADYILLCTKRTQNAAVAPSIIAHAKATAALVAFQNGLGVLDDLAKLIPPARVAATSQCVVNINVVREVGPGGAVFRWTSLRKRDPPCFVLSDAALAQAMDAAGLMAASTGVEAMPLVVNSKFLINCAGNAVNALSGLSIREMIRSYGYRQILLGVLAEVLAVYDALGMRYDSSTHVQYIKLLSFPALVVWPVTQLLLDSNAHTSMWTDLHHHRGTEVNYLNGHVVALGEKAGIATPLNQRLSKLVLAAEATQGGPPCLSPAQIVDNLEVDVEGSYVPRFVRSFFS